MRVAASPALISPGESTQPLASDRMLSGFVLRCLCDAQCVDVWTLQCSHVTDSTDGWMVQELAWHTQKR